MKNKIIIATAAIALLLAAGGGGYWLATQRMNAAMQAPVGTAEMGSSASGEKKPLYYYDPMYPQTRFDKPGKSPFMDMQLVPVYADEGADNGSVSISSRVQQNLGIRVAEVSEGSIDRKVEAVGSVAFDERAVVLVQAKVAGFVEKLFVRAPLDPVVKGQPLAEILAPEWVAAQEEFIALQNSPQANEALRQAARQRLLLLGMNESTIAAIAAEGKARPRITLLSPVSGVVGELAVREGMSVAPGAMLFRLNGIGSVWINADVPETQAAWIKPGVDASVTVPAWPGEKFKARVAALLPDVSMATRTLKVRIAVANPAGKLKPGMFANIAFAANSGKASSNALMVPSEAVIWTGTRSVVVVAASGADGAQQFKPVDVQVGAEADGMSEIKSGLAPGMKVVLSGQFLIDSEASLKSTGNRMAGMEKMAPAANKGEGRVEKIGKGVMTISHGPIPGLQMGAMTMEFQAPASAVAAGVKEGSMVSFELNITKKGEFVLDKVVPIDAGSKEAAGKKP